MSTRCGNFPHSEQFVRDAVTRMLEYANTTEMKRIRASDYGKYVRMMNEQFTSISQEIPRIFNVIVNNPDNFDISRMIDIFNRRNNINAGNTTYVEENKKVGKDYYKEFVAPKLKNLQIPESAAAPESRNMIKEMVESAQREQEAEAKQLAQAEDQAEEQTEQTEQTENQLDNMDETVDKTVDETVDETEWSPDDETESDLESDTEDTDEEINKNTYNKTVIKLTK